MVKVRSKFQEIQSFSPALDPRTGGGRYEADKLYVLDGKNYAFDSKGPKSAFGTRLLALGEVIGNVDGIVQHIEVANRCFVFTLEGIYELNSTNTDWIRLLDLTFVEHIPFLMHKKWTAAYLADGIYFAHLNYGLYKLTFEGFVRLTSDTTPGLPFNPIAVGETNGRFVVLGSHYVGWSAPSRPERFIPEIGGAGQQLLKDLVAGEPVTLATFQNGFLVWTTQDCMLAEFIGGDNVFRFRRMTTEQIPLDANCVEDMPDGSQLICTKQGIHLIQNGGEPSKIVPIFNEFIRSFLDHENGIFLRLTYSMEEDRLFVQVRDWTDHYVRTFVLAVALDKWGQFSERHLGVIKWGPKRGAYGYVDSHGVGHKFVEVYNREVTPHVFKGLDSNIDIGYIKPAELTPEIDTLLEMQELLIGGRPALPSWVDVVDIDLGRIPIGRVMEGIALTINISSMTVTLPIGCETLAQTPTLIVTPSMSLNQMQDNHSSLIDVPGDDKWWDDLSFPIPNLDTGEILQYVNKSYLYTQPDDYHNKTYLNVIHTDGTPATQYYPGAFTVDAQSVTHYAIHDDVMAVDRHDGDFWAIHDWWFEGVGGFAGSTLTRAVKSNNYQFQAQMFPVLRDAFDHASPDTGLGQTNYIVGFTANEIIIIHEVDSEKDFKLEALNKSSLARVSQHYVDPGVGNVNGPIEMGQYQGPNNFCIGPDDKVYHASWVSPSWSPNTYAFANGTRSFLYCFDPAAGTYTDITPWSAGALPITLPNPSTFGNPPLTSWGIKTIHYDRRLNKIVIFFGGEDNDTSTALFGANHSYWWEWGTYDTTTQAWVNHGQMPSSHYMDAGYNNCPKAEAVWCQVGWAPMDYIKNYDSLPMASPCQELQHTMEIIVPVVAGVIDIVDSTDPAQYSFQICVRDPAAGFAVTQRFGVDDSRYDALDAATGGEIINQFLRGVIRGNNLPGDLEPFSQYYAGGLLRTYYLPNRKYLSYGARAIDPVSFTQTPESADWNSDNSQFYYLLEP